MKILLCALICAASPAVATVVTIDPAPLASCLAAGNGLACAGTAVPACLAASDKDPAEADRLACIEAETIWWRDRVSTLSMEQALAAPPTAVVPGFAPSGSFRPRNRLQDQLMTLRLLCASPEKIANATCLLEKTAELAIDIENRSRETKAP